MVAGGRPRNGRRSTPVPQPYCIVCRRRERSTGRVYMRDDTRITALTGSQCSGCGAIG